MQHAIIIGGTVRCADGQAGSIGGLLINPNRSHVDYVILNAGGAGGREYFVPSGQIQRASSHELTLPCAWGDLEQLPHPDRHAEQGTVQNNLEDLCIAREHTPVRDADGSRIGLFHGAIVNADLEIQAILLDQAPDQALPITRIARDSDNTGEVVVYLASPAERAV
jgi:hypothetical protein